MIYNEREERHSHIVDVAKQMMTAARTAPKSKGVDIIEVAMAEGEHCEVLACEMERIAQKTGMKFFLRDAGNIRECEAVVLIATRYLPMGLNCEYCGFETCAERPEGVPCGLNSIDLGIAIGSACATAADLRVDSRVMFSAGLAALKLGWIEGAQQVIAIAVAASSKSPFFDRVSKK